MTHGKEDLICPDCGEQGQMVDECREYLFKIPLLPLEIVLRWWGAKVFWCKNCSMEDSYDLHKQIGDAYAAGILEGHLRARDEGKF